MYIIYFINTSNFLNTSTTIKHTLTYVTMNSLKHTDNVLNFETRRRTTVLTLYYAILTKIRTLCGELFPENLLSNELNANMYTVVPLPE